MFRLVAVFLCRALPPGTSSCDSVGLWPGLWAIGATRGVGPGLTSPTAWIHSRAGGVRHEIHMCACESKQPAFRGLVSATSQSSLQTLLGWSPAEWGWAERMSRTVMSRYVGEH